MSLKPYCSINLALDAIKNPIIDDKEKVFKYQQMIRDENKRMPRLKTF
jgi:two-component system phosphate regulon sensor histidine kinase PhoR